MLSRQRQRHVIIVRRSTVKSQVQEAPEWYDPQSLAEWLGVPLRTIYSWNHKGTGPRMHRIGKHARYRRADVERWLEDQAGDRPAA